MLNRSRYGMTLALGALVIAIGACANAYIRPDTDPSLRGPRFYIPRPYIVVLKPFPVAENTWVLPGKLAPDGIIVAVDHIDNTPLDGMVFTDAGAKGAAAFLKFPVATRDDAERSSIGAISGTDGGGLNLGLTDAQRANLLDQVINAGSEIDPDSAATGGSASAWVKRGDMTELRDPVNDLFEIRYLPDMSQRYVLVGEAGLGTAKIDAYLTRGWLAHHYGKEIDRTDLGRMVFGNVQAVLDIARAAGKTALIASTGGLGAIPVAAREIGATSGDDAPGEGLPRDTLLRFTVIEYAVPGVYPILRQDEMRERVDEQSEQKYYELEIPSSFQQPASAALPVAYRTTKVLIVSALRDGEDPTAEYRTQPHTTAHDSGSDLAAATRDVFDQVLSALQVQATHVTLTTRQDPTDGDAVELVATATRMEAFTDNELWEQFRARLAMALANTQTFPDAARVRLEFVDSP